MNINYLIIAFGELDISPLTIAIMVALTSLTFAAAAISSFKLFKFGPEDK